MTEADQTTGAGSGGFRLPAARPEHLQTAHEALRKIFPDNRKDVIQARDLWEKPLSQQEMPALSSAFVQLTSHQQFYPGQPLDLLDPCLDLNKFIFKGVNYYEHGPVTVGPHHLSMIFPGFTKPSAEEIGERVRINKENYGTMPGVESAYLGAITRAMLPRTILCIGEHKGMLTRHLAEQAPEAIIVTVDLPQTHYDRKSVKAPDAINRDFVRHSDAEIGLAWRTGEPSMADRIFQIFCDSTSLEFTNNFASATKGCFDLVVVDGGHSLNVVTSDLRTAFNVVSPGGVVAIDDFLKPARLFEVTEATLNARRANPKFLLHHLNWTPPQEDQRCPSNLAFFLTPREKAK